jgi:hypothetical protein
MRAEPLEQREIARPKPPLLMKQIWAIQPKLQVDHRLRDLAVFNLAIDSKLRGCDLMSLKVEGIAPNKFRQERRTAGRLILRTK